MKITAGDPAPVELNKLYTKERLSAMKIAPILECTVAHVYYLLIKYGIPRRKHSDPELISVAKSNLKRNYGKNNGRWKGPKTHICHMCRKDFQRSRSGNPTYKFCSKECYRQFSSLRLQGANNPRWKENSHETKGCKNCGKAFTIPRRFRQHFCSRDCWIAWLRADSTHVPNWKGGISKLPYPYEFDEILKEQIRERDSRTCQRCGLIETESLEIANRRLSVHHINYIKDDLSRTNLITLCHLCNLKVNANREHWQRFFEVKIKQIYSP